VGAKPTYPKPSPQGSRELRVQGSNGLYGAGGNKRAGRVIEPRKGWSGGADA